MHESLLPEAIVARQLEAYNAKNMEAWLATYANNAVQCELAGKVLAVGHAEIRMRTLQRFSEPNLHAALLKRCVMGKVVIDHEVVTRTFPEGPGTVELVCVYVVEDGLIQTASFSFGQPVMQSTTGG
jgi:hypothetical protein